MNKSEHHSAITDLTLLASRLRRRRDEWKHRAKTLEHQLRQLEAAAASTNKNFSLINETVDQLTGDNNRLLARVAELEGLLVPANPS